MRGHICRRIFVVESTKVTEVIGKKKLSVIHDLLEKIQPDA